MKPIVAIQGIAGSFHNEAARLLVSGDFDTRNCDNFAEVFKAVRTGTAQYGVVAVENSLQGSINAVYRLLARENLWVSGEVFLKIELYLISGEPKTELSGIKRVISQGVALPQCEIWLDKQLHDAVLEEYYDTAASVQRVVSEKSATQAAIAGKHAAEIHGGHIIAGPINDDPHNYTRFFLLSRERQQQPEANKTSIILQTGHAPGSLQRALQLFADNDINLSKLDSHPIPGDQWHYAFYIDFEASADSSVVQNVLKALEAQDCKVTVLGSYKAASLPV